MSTPAWLSSNAASQAILAAGLGTEALNPRTGDIDLLPTEALLYTLNDQDLGVPLVVRQAVPQLAPVVDAAVKALQDGGHLFYVGAGTSGRLGVLDASECPPTFGAHPEQVQGIIAGGEQALRHPVEAAEDSAENGRADLLVTNIQAGDVVVGISASGSAAYVVSAIETAKSLGCVTAGVTANGESLLAQAADHAVLIPVGPESVAGSSRLKSGTAQKLVLNMLSTAAFVQLGKTYGNWMVDVQPSNAKLKQRAARIVASLGSTEEKTLSMEEATTLLAESRYAVKPAVVMGRLGLSLKEAEAALTAAGGKLRQVLGQYG
jgi:N-acetylmuramic acid 6-phosphate etherase